MPSRDDTSTDGFETEDRELCAPPVDVDTETRERLLHTLYAIVEGATPEELADYVEDGFPESVTEALGRPGEREEMSAHVDLLLTVIQTPATV